MAKSLSEFIDVSEFNMIAHSKKLIKESVLLHAKIKKIINSYKSYMDANSYNYSNFMINIDKACDEYAAHINNMNAKKDMQEELK